MGLYSGGLINGRKFECEIWRANFREGLFFWVGGGGVGEGDLLSEFYGISLTV